MCLGNAFDRLYWPEEPSLTNEQLTVLLAQSCLETGWWRECYGYNLGNAKAHSQDVDHQYYACGESNLTPAQVKQAMALSKPRVDDPSKPDCVVVGPGEIKLWGNHPWARFLWFPTLDHGAEHYVQMLRKRFAKAWSSVLSGDPKRFAWDLKQLGYYTASFERYWPPLVSLFHRLLPLEIEEPSLIEAAETNLDKAFLLGELGAQLLTDSHVFTGDLFRGSRDTQED